MLNDFKHHPKSILILGPRQSGKSFLAKSLPIDIEINLANESDFQQMLKNPRLLEKIILSKISFAQKGKRQTVTIFIDEIQFIPSMLNTIQSLIDQYQQTYRMRFVITGSSPRKLHKNHNNLLPGRIFSYQLFPLSYWELKSSKVFNLQKCLELGSLPEIYLKPYGKKLLDHYVGIYLKEEILAESLVRNVKIFHQFLTTLATMSWQELNYSSIASDSEIPKENIRRFIEILHETLIIHRIDSYQNKKISRKIIQREKILFFDIGVRNSLLNIAGSHFDPIYYGQLFEQWIVIQLLTFKNYHEKSWKIFYYRDDRKLEVDLIIQTQKAIYPIEIKWGEEYRASWIKNLKEFSLLHDVEIIRPILLYRGKYQLLDERCLVLPYSQFLDDIHHIIQ